MRSLLALALMACAAACAAAIPNHFADRMEAALTCRGEWSADYWHAYFSTYLGAPLRDWGEARWYNAEGAELAGNPIKEVFINLPASTAMIVGVLIEVPIADVRKKLEERLGMTFVELPGPYPRFLSRGGSVLVGLADPEKPQTKWYCARWNLGNRP